MTKICLLRASIATKFKEIFFHTQKIKYVASSAHQQLLLLPEVGRNLHFSAVKLKYDKKSSRKEEPSESDSDDDDVHSGAEEQRDSKIVRTHVNSLRTDLLLKAGLGMARNKVEEAFYESRIRVNGEKIPKKSLTVQLDSEIDLIKGFSKTNPSFINVSRVVLISARAADESIKVVLRRYKTLLIENYSGTNAYKSSES